MSNSTLSDLAIIICPEIPDHIIAFPFIEKIKTLLVLCKDEYCKKYFKKHNKNSKKIWSGIKEYQYQTKIFLSSIYPNR